MSMQVVGACAVAGLVCLAGGASAQPVQFRLIERTGQSVVNSSDALLEIAVQARVTGGNLGGFNFDIHTGDSEARGTLARARISNSDHTYFSGSPWTANSSVGSGGVASTYSYLAGISSSFNGLINISGASFTNNPNENEIGLVAGAATGAALLGTPGLDIDMNGIPDLAPSNVGGTSANSEVSVLEPTLSGPYFGNGQFIDLYRFRYTVTDFTARILHFTLADVGAQTFTQLLYNNGAWGAQNVPALNISLGGLDVTVSFPSPGTGCAAVLGAAAIGRRRKVAVRPG